MPRKIVLLLAGVGEEGDAALAAEAEHLRLSLTDVRAARALPGAAPAETEHGVTMVGWQAAVEATAADDDAAIAAVAGAARRLGTAVDAAASAVVLGTEHEIADRGGGPLTLYYALRRKPESTTAAFSARYLDVHSQFGLASHGWSSYHQLHADPVASERAAAAAGFGVADIDGLSQLSFADETGMIEMFAPTPEARAAIEDEQKFTDGGRNSGFVAREL